MKVLKINIPASSFTIRKNFLIVSVFSFCVCLSVFFSVKDIMAFSMNDYAISFEVADYGLRLYVEKFQKASGSSSIGTFGSCSDGVFSGNYFTIGNYEVVFYGVGGEKLDCSKTASSVAFIRSTGFYRGTSTVVQRWPGKVFYCTGSRPANTTVHQDDNINLTANVPWTYSATNTGPKCQYKCSDGFSWNGISCTT